MLTSSPKIRLSTTAAAKKIPRARGARMNAMLIQEMLGLDNYVQKIRDNDGSEILVDEDRILIKNKPVLVSEEKYKPKVVFFVQNGSAFFYIVPTKEGWKIDQGYEKLVNEHYVRDVRYGVQGLLRRGDKLESSLVSINNYLVVNGRYEYAQLAINGEAIDVIGEVPSYHTYWYGVSEGEIRIMYSTFDGYKDMYKVVFDEKSCEFVKTGTFQEYTSGLITFEPVSGKFLTNVDNETVLISIDGSKTVLGSIYEETPETVSSQSSGGEETYTRYWVAHDATVFKYTCVGEVLSGYDECVNQECTITTPQYIPDWDEEYVYDADERAALIANYYVGEPTVMEKASSSSSSYTTHATFVQRYITHRGIISEVFYTGFDSRSGSSGVSKSIANPDIYPKIKVYISNGCDGVEDSIEADTSGGTGFGLGVTEGASSESTTCSTYSWTMTGDATYCENSTTSSSAGAGGLASGDYSYIKIDEWWGGAVEFTTIKVPFYSYYGDPPTDVKIPSKLFGVSTPFRSFYAHTYNYETMYEEFKNYTYEELTAPNIKLLTLYGYNIGDITKPIESSSTSSTNNLAVAIPKGLRMSGPPVFYFGVKPVENVGTIYATYGTEVARYSREYMYADGAIKDYSASSGFIDNLSVTYEPYTYSQYMTVNGTVHRLVSMGHDGTVKADDVYSQVPAERYLFLDTFGTNVYDMLSDYIGNLDPSNEVNVKIIDAGQKIISGSASPVIGLACIV